MALVQRSDGAFLIRQGPLQWGTRRQAVSFFKIGLQLAIDLACGLRASGIDAYATSDEGTVSDPSYVPPSRAVDLSVSWPSSWRVEIEQLGENRFCHRFLDTYNVQQSVIGKSPQDVVDRLFGSIDTNVRDYIKAVTPAPEIVTPAPPPAPVPPPRFLRPGDRRLTAEDELELSAQRAAMEVPKAPPADLEYRWFYENTRSNDIKTRMQKDEGFAAWMDREGVLKIRSN
jgi:hypothetical protein